MEMENHPIKAIMDLSHLVRRATERQMADLEISSVQSPGTGLSVVEGLEEGTCISEGAGSRV